MQKKLADVPVEGQLTHLPCLFESISCFLNTFSVLLTEFALQQIQQTMSALYSVAERGEQTGLDCDA